jgi:hypothetical protein
MKLKLSHPSIGLVLLAALVQTQIARSAVTFSVTPSAVSNTYNGTITLQIAGLTNGETVVIQKYLNASGQGVIATNDWLVEQFNLTDGQPGMVIGGVTNFNVPGDTDGMSNGQITADLNFQNGDFMQDIVGEYLFKLSSPVGHFSPITNEFSVTNYPFPQKFTGTVFSNGSSTVVPYAMVMLSPGGGDSSPTAGVMADSSGAYTIRAAVGAYVTVATGEGYVFSGGKHTGTPLTLGAGQTITTNLAITNATATISGRLVDATNSSLGLAGILMFAQAESGLMGVGFTDANGDFTVGVFPSPVQWDVAASDSSFLVSGYLRPQDTNANAGTSGLTLAASKGTALFYGSVLDTLGNPIQGVEVGASDNNNLYEGDAYTDANGNYVTVALGGLTNDSWWVGINQSASNYVFSQPAIEQNGNASINAGEALQANFTGVPAPYTISGTLTGATGSPFAGIGVYANATINGVNYNLNSVDTDNNGDYSLNVSSGTWNLGVNTGGGGDSLPAGYFVSAPTVVVSNTSVANINITALMGTHTISGSLTDNHGNPIAGVDVYAYVSGQNYNLNATTDTNGNYSLTVINGTWTVGVNQCTDCGYSLPADYLQPPQQTVVISNDNGTANFTAILATNTISGSLTDNSGNPIAGVGVGADTSIGTNYYQSYEDTDIHGNYSLYVVNGSWNVWINRCTGCSDSLPANYLQPPSQTVWITNDNGTANFIAILATNTISGSVKDNHGNPIVGVGVMASASIGTNSDQAYVDTDNNGDYTLYVANGMWTVNLNCSGGGDSLNSLGNYACPPQLYVTISGNNATTNFVVQSCGGISIATPLPSGEVGVYYDQFLQASSCNPPFTWLNLSGSLPQNVGWNQSAGEISGTPTNAGTFNLMVEVKDSNGATTNQAVSWTIVAPVQINTSSLPNDNYSAPYSQQLLATNGQAPYSWSLAAGSAGLPLNMSLSPTGLISGSPTNSGVFGFTVLVTDNLGGMNQQALSLTVLPETELQITTTNLAAATQNAFYTNALLAAGGQQPYTWSLATGSASLPAGLTLATNGGLSGTPTSGGTNSFTVQVKDASGTMATQFLTLIINANVGSLQVTLSPATAVSAGAAWGVDGNGQWQASGATVTNLPAGDHTIAFKPVSDWITPSSQTVVISSGATNTATGAYTLVKKGEPSLTITSPKSGQSVSNEPFVITGKVTDKVAVEQVFYKLNGASWTPANSTDVWTNWTATVSNLNPGANTLSAYVVDNSGKSNTITAFKFKYVPSAVLDLKTNGIGKVTPNDGGKWLEIGTKYTLKAVPPADNLYIFSNWVATGSTNFVSNNAVLKFIMQSNLMLTANFAPNPFLPMKGTFGGLFLNPTNVTEAGSGFLTLNLTASGAFSGKITLPGGPYSFASNFDAGGQVQITIPKAKPSPITINLLLTNSAPTNEQITGTISNTVWAAWLTADRAVFSASTNKAADYEGQYTVAIPGNINGVGSPGGSGWAALTINSAGAISMNGSLADGTAISQSSVSVSKDGRWPLYAPYKNPPTTSVGAVFGWMTFSNAPASPAASTLGGPLYWFRPAGQTPKAYTDGFTNPAVPVIGSRFSLANDVPALVLTNGQAILEGVTLSPALTNSVSITDRNALDVTTRSNALSLKLTTSGTSAGKISGSFDYPGSGTKADTTISGVVLQEQDQAVGYFLRTNESGAFLLQEPATLAAPDDAH